MDVPDRTLNPLWPLAAQMRDNGGDERSVLANLLIVLRGCDLDRDELEADLIEWYRRRGAPTWNSLAAWIDEQDFAARAALASMIGNRDHLVKLWEGRIGDGETATVLDKAIGEAKMLLGQEDK